MASDSFPITFLTRELTAFAGRTLPYRKLWELCLDGSFPAVQRAGRWHVKRSDLPVIAAACGLIEAPAPAAKSSPRRARATA